MSGSVVSEGTGRLGARRRAGAAERRAAVRDFLIVELEMTARMHYVTELAVDAGCSHGRKAGRVVQPYEGLFVGLCASLASRSRLAADLAGVRQGTNQSVRHAAHYTWERAQTVAACSPVPQAALAFFNLRRQIHSELGGCGFLPQLSSPDMFDVRHVICCTSLVILGAYENPDCLQSGDEALLLEGFAGAA